MSTSITEDWLTPRIALVRVSSSWNTPVKRPVQRQATDVERLHTGSTGQLSAGPTNVVVSSQHLPSRGQEDMPIIGQACCILSFHFNGPFSKEGYAEIDFRDGIPDLGTDFYGFGAGA